MKILVITTSRADWNGLSMVAHNLAGYVEGGQNHHVTVYALDRGDVPSVDPCALRSLRFRLPSDTRKDCALASGTLIADITDAIQMDGLFDLAIINGDRYEALACAYACKMMGVPIAHISGGDITLGSDDDAYRDAITALADLHFPTNALAWSRLSAMARGRVLLTGDPGIDRICLTPTLTRDEWRAKYGLEEGQINPVVIFHPVAGPSAALGCAAMLRALERLTPKPMKALFLGVNADPGARGIELLISGFCDQHTQHMRKDNVLPGDFYSWLTWGDFLIGNSSAGFHEAPLFNCPVVNIGDRQKGRIPTRHTIQVDPTEEDIWYGIQVALTPRVGRIESPYGDGKACERIVRAIKEWGDGRNTAS